MDFYTLYQFQCSKIILPNFQDVSKFMIPSLPKDLDFSTNHENRILLSILCHYFLWHLADVGCETTNCRTTRYVNNILKRVKRLALTIFIYSMPMDSDSTMMSCIVE